MLIIQTNFEREQFQVDAEIMMKHKKNISSDLVFTYLLYTGS